METVVIFLCFIQITVAQYEKHDDVIDMSHRLKEGEVLGYPTYPMGYNFSNFFNGTVLNGVVWAEANQFSMINHVGTHVDVPCHFDPKAWRMQDVPFDRFVGPAAMIDIKEQCDKDPNYEMTVEDIEEWEDANGRVPEGAFVMLYTGGEWRWGNMSVFFGSDESVPDNYTFPGITLESADLFLERKIKAIGMDWGVIDSARSVRLPGTLAYGVHQKILPRNILIYEYVSNVGLLSPTGYTIYGLPLRLWNSCGGPVRMIAVKNPPSAAATVKTCGLLMMVALFVGSVFHSG